MPTRCRCRPVERRSSRPGRSTRRGTSTGSRSRSPITGFLTADLAAKPGSSLDAQILVENESGVEYAGGANAAGSTDSRVTGFAVTQGQTYDIQAFAAQSAPSGDRAGEYDLNVSFAYPMVGHSFGTATPLVVSPTGGASSAGIIAIAGVDDYYTFVAPESMNLVVREGKPTGSGLDTLLTVYDAAGPRSRAAPATTPGGPTLSATCRPAARYGSQSWRVRPITSRPGPSAPAPAPTNSRSSRTRRTTPSPPPNPWCSPRPDR